MVFVAQILFISLTFTSPSQAVVGICSRRAFYSELPSLVHNARNFAKSVRRKELSAIAESAGLSSQEVEQIRGAVGALQCPNPKGGPPASGSAFMIGSNAEIITAAHVISGDIVTRRDLSQCFFENFEIPPVRRYLARNCKRNILTFGANSMSDDRKNDRARLCLSSPITSAKPFTISKNNPVKEDEHLLLLTAQNRDFQASGKDPIVVQCGLKRILRLKDDIPRIKTDCDTDQGGSGGVFLSRIDGKLVARGLLVSLKGQDISGEIPDHEPFDANVNYAGGLAIEGSFASWF